MSSTTNFDVGTGGASSSDTVSISGSFSVSSHRWSGLLIAIAYNADYASGTVTQIETLFGGGSTFGAFFVALGSAISSSQTIEFWFLPRGEYLDETSWQGLTATLAFPVNQVVAMAFEVSYLSILTGPIADQTSTDGTTSPVSGGMTVNPSLGGRAFSIGVPTSDMEMLVFATVNENNGITLTLTAGTELARVTQGSSPTIFTLLAGYVDAPPAGSASAVTWSESANRDWLTLTLVTLPPTLEPAMARGTADLGDY